MPNIVFPLITDLEPKIPVYLGAVGCKHAQEHILRKDGYRYLQWIQCTSGSGELLIHHQKYSIEKGQGMLLLPHVPHEYYSLEDPWIVNWIAIGGFAASQVFINAGLEYSPVLTINRPEITLLAMEKALDLANSRKTMKNLDCSKIVYEIILDIIAFSHTPTNDQMMDQNIKLKPIFDYIEDHYHQVITLAELSGILQVTPQYFCTLFKRITGVRIIEYVNSIRIKYSKELLLRRRTLTIKQIAETCGFENVSYFCEVFKKLEKLTPTEFRNLHGEGIA